MRRIPHPSRGFVSPRAALLPAAVLLALGAGIALLAGPGALAPAPSDGSQQDPLAQPFVGITTDSTVIPGLFPIRSTGVSTEPVRLAADRFLGVLTPEQRAITTFGVDDIQWRRWSNVSRFERHGVSFDEMTEGQRAAAFDMVRAAMSARGFQQTRDVMRLNGYLAEVLDRWEVYGEYLYWITVMGEPHPTEPWGWQLEGHHLLVTYFVLGDQVVMTPTFMGSEPVVAESGQYAGAEVLQEEQALGYRMMASLSPAQRERAHLGGEKTGNNALAQAFRDNLVLDYAGIRGAELDAGQRTGLLELIGIYVGNMAEGHARVRMDEVEAHLDDTWFAWLGEVDPDGVYYYRVHSPVILIEFDHQLPVGLPGDRVPNRRHIHSVVRTPNGNDYGKDLLRQHHEAHDHDGGSGHGHRP
jgi:hypothetical protein